MPDGPPREPGVSTARKKPKLSKTPLVVEEAPVMCMDKIGPWAEHKLTQDDLKTVIGGGAHKPTIAEEVQVELTHAAKLAKR